MLKIPLLSRSCTYSPGTIHVSHHDHGSHGHTSVRAVCLTMMTLGNSSTLPARSSIGPTSQTAFGCYEWVFPPLPSLGCTCRAFSQSCGWASPLHCCHITCTEGLSSSFVVRCKVYSSQKLLLFLCRNQTWKLLWFSSTHRRASSVLHNSDSKGIITAEIIFYAAMLGIWWIQWQVQECLTGPSHVAAAFKATANWFAVLVLRASSAHSLTQGKWSVTKTRLRSCFKRNFLGMLFSFIAVPFLSSRNKHWQLERKETWDHQ